MTTEIIPDSARPTGSHLRYDLNDSTWLVRACRRGIGLGWAEAVSRTGSSPAGCLPARVPGLVPADLLRAGRIADPHFGEPSGAREVEEQDFVYLRRVILRAEDLENRPRARLVFDSLDTFASVFVNGNQVAHHENQFRRLFVDVTDVLHPGENWLAVAFAASGPATLQRAGPELLGGSSSEHLYVRKSALSFAGDGPVRVPTVGIAGPVHLEFSRGLFADDLWLSGQPIGETGGSISAHTEYTPHDTFVAEVGILIEGEERLRKHIPFHAGHTQGVTLSDTLPRVERWQPHDRGKPTLYRVELRVTRAGEIVHTLEGRVGICRTELDLGTTDSRHFRLLVNEEPYFVRGATWMPMDLLHTRTTDAELRSYLELLVGAGVNLLRVWGGGIIERREFYDACDELGLLVWQDFPYAHGVYPASREFLEEARREAEDIVRRLRRHTCLAIWCGNDACEPVAGRSAPELRRHPLFYEVLREVTARLDPQRPYWPRSPASLSSDEPANSPREGDHHDESLGRGRQPGRPFDQASSCSALGAQALPQRETLEDSLPLHDPRTLNAERGAVTSELSCLLARRGAQLEKLFVQSSEYAYPRNLDTLIATTQMVQADTIGRKVRQYRRAGAGGVILWTAASSWPSVCSSLIDWYRRPKQAFYAVRRAFAPIVLGLAPTDASRTWYTAYVDIDGPSVVEGTVEISLRHLASGKVLRSERAPVHVTGPGAQDVANLNLPADCDRRCHALVAVLRQVTKKGVAQELREVQFLHPHGRKVAARASGPTGGEDENVSLRAIWRNEGVHLVSNAWQVRVGLESYESPVIWDDNYVDLLPGEERWLRVIQGQPEHLWLVANFGQRVALPHRRWVRL